LNYHSFAAVITFLNIFLGEVIKESKWSNEIKGNYEGALVTRLESLTNGIYSKIFAKKEIYPLDLFDKNVIIDLSRIGSSETKSLIMGVLMLKLQEHRIASRSNNAKAMNEPLKHITILEEAHNLLKRTSADGGGSGSVAAKAVEMLSNAIAEMRTYGEGFIIVDQAPGLLDMSVIRNTNTKIIHRLPDKTDRELVGLAAMLNEDQVTEIARLQRGVAAIYQSNWIEPVLCKVSEFPEKECKSYIFTEGVK
jgi:DNA helicase HerA-like ATPase